MGKSEVMSIGEVNEGDYPFKVARDHIKVLGVYLSVKEKEARDLTWSGAINKVRKVVNMWKQR